MRRIEVKLSECLQEILSFTLVYGRPYLTGGVRARRSGKTAEYLFGLISREESQYDRILIGELEMQTLVFIFNITKLHHSTLINDINTSMQKPTMPTGFNLLL